MTKVITYNNIQLSFQADTSGIKASKAELGALTREVNAQRTPLEKFMRQLQVINEASAKMAPKDVDARLRAVTKRFIDAEAAAGNYNKALYTVSQLVPKLSGEMDRLAYETRKAELAQKEFAETERKAANRKLQAMVLQPAESAAILQMKQELELAKEIAKQEQTLAEKQAGIRKALLKQEREQYVNDHLRAEAEKALLAQKQRRIQIEDMLARIGARQAGINLPAGSAMTQKQIADLTEKIANHRQTAAKAEESAAGHLAENSRLYHQIQSLNFAQLSTDQKRLASIQAFTKAEQARAQLIVDNLNQEARLMNTAANPQLIANAWNSANANIEEYTKYLIQVEHIQTRLNIESERQKGSLQAIVELEKKVEQLKFSQLPAAQQAYKTQQKLIEDVQRQELARAKQLVAMYKEEQKLAGQPVDRNRIKAIYDEARQTVQKFIGLLQQVQAEEKKIEQTALAKAAAEKAAADAIDLQNKKLQEEIQKEKDAAAAVQRRMNLYRQLPGMMSKERMAMLSGGARDILSGATMGGLPGGMMLGMSTKMLGGFAAAAAVVGSLKAYSDLRDNLVLLESQFGSTALAAEKFGEIRRLAAASPLETNELLKATITLSQYGFTAQEVIPVLEQLTAVSSGNAMRMDGLARAFSQTRASGRLMAQEVLQFVNSGFNPLAEMSRVTHIEMSRLKKLMEEGKISFQDVADSLKSATSEGGAFFGQTEKQAEELSAKFNELKDSVRQLGEALGEALAPLAKSTMETVSPLFKMMAASGQFSSMFVKAALGPEKEFNQSFIAMQRDLETRMHDIYAQMWGLDFGAIAEKDGKLFQNLLAEDAAYLTEQAQKQLDKNTKAAKKLEERLEGLTKISKLEDDIAKATMTDRQLKDREAASRLEDIKKEAMKRAEIEIQIDRLRRGLATADGKVVEERTNLAIAKIDQAKKDLERLPFLDMAKKINEEERKKFLKDNPQVAIMQKAKDIADMIRLNLINQDAGAKALADAMMENTQATKQQSQELPKTIQAGTVEAYQAMFGRDNTAKLQLAEQKKQVTKQAEANKLLEKIANKPGMKKV